jgi:hypothetical protein
MEKVEKDEVEEVVVVLEEDEGKKKLKFNPQNPTDSVLLRQYLQCCYVVNRLIGKFM